MHLFLPQNLNLEQLLKDNPPPFKYDIDNFKYIIGIVVRMYALYKDYQDQPYVPLSSTLLQKYIHSYKSHIQHLIEVGVLETDNQYIVGTKSKGYRLSKEYSDQGARIETVTKTTLVKRAKVEDEKNKRKVDTDYHHLTKWFDPNLQVNMDGAIHKLKELAFHERRAGKPRAIERYHSRLVSLEMLNNGMYYMSVDDTVKRFHSNLTNLKSELRNYLSYAGEQLCSVDVKNSQPFISTILFRPSFYSDEKQEAISLYQLSPTLYEKIKPNIPTILHTLHNSSLIMLVKKEVEECENDIQLYCTLVDKGLLYQYMGTQYEKLTGIPMDATIPEDKAYLKKGVFTTLFSDNRFLAQPEAEIKRLFRDLFPNVYSVFASIKQGGNKEVLPIALQLIESEIVINRATRHIDAEYGIPIFTIHDSIVTITPCKEWVYSMLKREFEQAIGLMPALSVEEWK